MSDWLDQSQIQIDPAVLRLVPGEIARKFLVLPLRREGDVLVVAVASPPDANEENRLRFVLNRDLQYAEAPLMSLKFAIWRHYGAEPKS